MKKQKLSGSLSGTLLRILDAFVSALVGLSIAGKPFRLTQEQLKEPTKPNSTNGLKIMAKTQTSCEFVCAVNSLELDQINLSLRTWLVCAASTGPKGISISLKSYQWMLPDSEMTRLSSAIDRGESQEFLPSSGD